MPFVNTFFGLELATGARAAGIYTLLVSFPLAAEGYLYLKALHEVNDDEDKVLQRHKIENTEFGLNMRKDEMSVLYDNYRKYSMEMGISYMCCAILLFLSSICLLIGISKEKPQLTMPWLVTDALATLYFLYRYIYIGFVRQIFYAEEPIIGAILLFIAMYFFIIVYSYKQQLMVVLNQGTSSQPNMVMTIRPNENENKDLPPPYSAYFPYPPPPSYSPSPNPPPYVAEQTEGSSRNAREEPARIPTSSATR